MTLQVCTSAAAINPRVGVEVLSGPDVPAKCARMPRFQPVAPASWAETKTETGTGTETASGLKTYLDGNIQTHVTHQHCIERSRFGSRPRDPPAGPLAWLLATALEFIGSSPRRWTDGAASDFSNRCRSAHQKVGPSFTDLISLRIYYRSSLLARGNSAWLSHHLSTLIFYPFLFGPSPASVFSFGPASSATTGSCFPCTYPVFRFCVIPSP